jgi:hypothetical protein
MRGRTRDEKKAAVASRILPSLACSHDRYRRAGCYGRKARAVVELRREQEGRSEGRTSRTLVS